MLPFTLLLLMLVYGSSADTVPDNLPRLRDLAAAKKRWMGTAANEHYFKETPYVRVNFV